MDNIFDLDLMDSDPIPSIDPDPIPSIDPDPIPSITPIEGPIPPITPTTEQDMWDIEEEKKKLKGLFSHIIQEKEIFESPGTTANKEIEKIFSSSSPGIVKDLKDLVQENPNLLNEGNILYNKKIIQFRREFEKFSKMNVIPYNIAKKRPYMDFKKTIYLRKSMCGLTMLFKNFDFDIVDYVTYKTVIDMIDSYKKLSSGIIGRYIPPNLYKTLIENITLFSSFFYKTKQRGKDVIKKKYGEYVEPKTDLNDVINYFMSDIYYGDPRRTFLSKTWLSGNELKLRRFKLEPIFNYNTKPEDIKKISRLEITPFDVLRIDPLFMSQPTPKPSQRKIYKEMFIFDCFKKFFYDFVINYTGGKHYNILCPEHKSNIKVLYVSGHKNQQVNWLEYFKLTYTEGYPYSVFKNFASKKPDIFKDYSFQKYIKGLFTAFYIKSIVKNDYEEQRKLSEYLILSETNLSKLIKDNPKTITGFLDYFGKELFLSETEQQENKDTEIFKKSKTTDIISITEKEDIEMFEKHIDIRKLFKVDSQQDREINHQLFILNNFKEDKETGDIKLYRQSSLPYFFCDGGDVSDNNILNKSEAFTDDINIVFYKLKKINTDLKRFARLVFVITEGELHNDYGFVMNWKENPKVPKKFGRVPLSQSEKKTPIPGFRKMDHTETYIKQFNPIFEKNDLVRGVHSMTPFTNIGLAIYESYLDTEQ